MRPIMAALDKAALTETEVSERIAAVFKAVGIEALITGAHITAIFPDGERALFKNLEVDTRK